VNKRTVALGLLLSVICAAAGCSALQPAPETPAEKAQASQWIGKRRSEVVRKLGEPTEAVPLVETGGEMLIYAHRGQTHYVFESAPGGVIDKAAVVE
jgi:hypothetical protein